MNGSTKKVIHNYNLSGKYNIILFVLVFLTHLPLNFMLPHMSAFPTEVMSKTAAAYFAGFDWSAVVSQTDFYGTGFYIILTPLFYLTSNPVIIRQVTLALIVLIVSLQAVICFRIMTFFLNVTNEKFALFLSFTLSFLPVIRSNMAINEPPLEFFMWLILYLTLANIHYENKQKTVRNTVIIALILCYIQTIHERALIFIVAYVFTAIIYNMIFKKKAIAIVPFGFTVGVGFLLSSRYIDFARNILWASQEVTNSVDHMSEKSASAFMRLFDFVGLKSYFNVILSEVFTANIHTAGFFLVAFLTSVVCIITFIKNKVKKKTVLQTESFEMFIIVLFGISLVGTILVMGLITLNGAIISYETSVAAKSYCYLRYFFVYFPPIMMVTFVKLYQNSKFIKPIIGGAFLLFVILSRYVTILFAPIMQKNPSLTLDRFHYFSALTLRKAEEPLNSRHVLICITIIMLLYALLWVLYKKGKVMLILGITFCILSYEYVYETLNYNTYFSDLYYGYINSYKEQVYSNRELKQRVTHVYTEHRYAGWNSLLEMPELTITLGRANELKDGEIMLADGKLAKKYYRGNYYIKLDDNEFVYFADEVLKDIFIDEGFEVIDIN